MATPVLMAALIALPATAAPAHADCGDPGQPACTGPVPTPAEVAAVVGQLTNPDTADPQKATLVEGGLSTDELGQLGQKVHRLSQDGVLPFAINVTDIQPAINNLAGVTVSLTGPHVPIPVVRPMVLVKQGEAWLLTHDTYDPTFIQELTWILDRVGGGGGGVVGGGPPLPPFSFFDGR